MRQSGGEGAGLIHSPHVPDELGDYSLDHVGEVLGRPHPASSPG